MGDRTTRYYKCPKCKNGEVEEYDAPSSLMFVATCNKCNYKDPLGYYEAPNNVIELCTNEEAIKKGLVMDCPKCKNQMTYWEKEEYQKCIMCKQDEQL